jgi:hypothetical protein
MLAPHKLRLSSATFETENIFKSPYSSLYFQDFAEVPNVKKEHFSRMEEYPRRADVWARFLIREVGPPSGVWLRLPLLPKPYPLMHSWIPQMVGSDKASPSVRGSGFGFSSRSLLTYTPIRGSVFGDFPRWGGRNSAFRKSALAKRDLSPYTVPPRPDLGGQKRCF